MLHLVFERARCLLETLTNNKWPLGVDPGGHHFVILDCSINNTPVFVSAVVIYKNIAQLDSAPASEADGRS